MLQRNQIPTIKTIEDLESIHLKNDHSMLKDLEILLPCDVNNPLLGLKGSAYVYGPQKGMKIDDFSYFDA